MVATQIKSLTLAQFLALPETKPATEYITSEKIVQKPMRQGKHRLLQLKLIFLINSILKKSGVAIAFSELRCTIGGRSIIPDVVTIKNENILKDDDGKIASSVANAPDWVIEILSPDQSTTKVITNIIHCVECGTQLAWLIDSAEKIILTYQPDKQVQVIDTLDRELIVPEFSRSVTLTAGDIFG